MRRFISVFVRNTVLVNVLMAIILMSGGVAGFSMVKELFPEIDIEILMVTVAYPGADPEEVEEGISRKIEEAIDGTEGIKRYITVSSENFSRTMIEAYEGFDLDTLYTDVRNAIDSISTFPVDAEKPTIAAAKLRDELILLSVWGDQPERVLKEFSEDLKDKIQGLDAVSQVNIFGAREYEIGIEVSEERLREYGLSFAQVASAVRRGSLNLSGGNVRTKGEEIRLRTVGRAYQGEEFADIVVLARPGGDIIRLGDIASVKDAFIEDQIVSTFNGEACIVLGIFKTPQQDAIQIAKEVRGFVDEYRAGLPAGLNLTLWSDRTESIETQINLLLRNGMIGLALVFLSLWLFLELRLSFWVTMGIPISLSGGLLIMWLMGSSINQLSLFGLIMVLGIVVDDAIIVGEAIYVHRRRGDGPMLAAINGVTEVGLPVLAAVTTSIVAFVPLFFVDGVMGKFVAMIPVVVIAALTTSLVESIFLLPAHLNHLPEMNAEHQSNPSLAKRIRGRINRGIDFVINRIYRGFVSKAIQNRYIAVSVAVALLILTVGVVQGGYVKFVLFPDRDSPDIVSSIEFPSGTPLSVTGAAVAQMEAAFSRVIDRYPMKDGVPIVKNIYAVTGMSGGGEFDRAPGNHLGNVRVELVRNTERLVTAQEILIAWEEEIGKTPGAVAHTYVKLEKGPPGASIEIQLQGADVDTLLLVAGELKQKLATYDGVIQISDTYRPGKKELRLGLKPEARALGIQLEDLARQVYAGFYGEEALRLQRGRDDIRVRVRYTADERAELAKLQDMRIRTPQGREVPFFSVASVEFAQGYSSITRIDGQKTISVTAENDPQRANPDEVLGDIAATAMPDLEARYPGFTWSFEGGQKQSRDAFSGLASMLPMALFAIYMIIAAVFRSYVQPLVIMVTIPFGIIGAVYGHMVLGLDLFMFSVFGMVALTGVVVNDAIVLIEAVNSNIAAGDKVFDAIVRGGLRRFRAIMLTSVSTVGGLMPLILEKDSQAQMVVPMAVSLAAGVLFATVLTLVFIPCLLLILNDMRRVAYWFLRMRWPTREEVEPARLRHIDPLKEDNEVGDALIAK